MNLKNAWINFLVVETMLAMVAAFMAIFALIYDSRIGGLMRERPPLTPMGPEVLKEKVIPDTKPFAPDKNSDVACTHRFEKPRVIVPLDSKHQRTPISIHRQERTSPKEEPLANTRLHSKPINPRTDNLCQKDEEFQTISVPPGRIKSYNSFN